MTDFVQTAIDGHIATVTLARPDKKNAMTFEMFDALFAAAEALRDGPIRAVILKGEGGCFSAGLDLGMMAQLAGQLDQVKADLSDIGPYGNRYQRPCCVWRSLPVPVIAALDGVCFGAGAQLALGADIRIMAPDAKFALREVQWGLMPDMGVTALLPGLVGPDRAKLMMMTGRSLSGPEALAWGLTTDVADDPYAAALALAQEIAGRSPSAVAGVKRLVEDGWGANFPLEAELQGALIGSPHQIEAVMARMQKREARFE
ncbi:MAG: crotonase/enoyl-CoA hydratase family protein [Shimia sp.]